MPKSINLSDKIIDNAMKHGEVYDRTVPKQIEHWAKIGKIAEENPDLSYSFVKDILQAKAESSTGDTSPYEFD